MTFSIKKVGLITGLVLVLGGCSGGTSDCADGTVKDTVLSIIESNIKSAKWARQAFDKGLVDDIELTNIKTVNYQENIDRYSCEATYRFTYKGHEASRDIEYVNSFLEEEGETEVAVYGVDDVKALLMGAIMTKGS